MRPVEFPQQNGTRTAPKGEEERVLPLPVYSDGQTCVSRWECSWRERMIVLLTGRVWVSVWSGRTQPPILIQASSMFPRRSFKTFLRHILLTNDAPRWNRLVLWFIGGKEAA